MQGGHSKDGETHTESAPYRETVDRVNRANRRIWKVVACVLAVVVLALTAQDVYLTLTVRDIGAKVDTIRSAQQTNTRVSHCQNKAFDQVLGELLLRQKITAPAKC